MEVKRRKLSDLDIGGVYRVLGYLPFNGQFGDTYIIKCKASHSDEIFEMFATKLIASYISQYNPTDKFTFVVKRNSKKDYMFAEISGYYPKGELTHNSYSDKWIIF